MCSKNDHHWLIADRAIDGNHTGVCPKCRQTKTWPVNPYTKPMWAKNIAKGEKRA